MFTGVQIFFKCFSQVAKRIERLSDYIIYVFWLLYLANMCETLGEVKFC